MNKSTIAFSLAAALSVHSTSVLAADAISGANVCQSRAQFILDSLDAGEFENSRKNFDEKMSGALTAEQLKGMWESLPQQAGKRIKTAPATSTRGNDSELVAIPMQYEKAWLELQVSCSADGQVNGLFVRPGKDPGTNTAPSISEVAAGVPSYVDASKFTETELTIASAGFDLPATLSMPTGDSAVAGVVLVHGSGPLDRDQSISGNKPFRDLAQGLASRGIAVLRYEKRSKAFPKSFSDKVYTVREEVTEDAVSALKTLSAQKNIDSKRVYVIGHSQGAMLAPRIAEEVKSLAGMVLLAAPARQLVDIIPFQLEYLAGLDGTVDEQEAARLKMFGTTMERIRALTPADQEDKTLHMGVPAAYWIDLASYKPIETAASIAIPLLLIQGEGDYQVTMKEDFQPWVKALETNAWFTAKSFPGIGHLYTPSGNPPSPADYGHAGNVAKPVIEAIATWIDSRKS